MSFADSESIHPTFAEEAANAISHGIGVLLSVAALVLLTISASGASAALRLPTILGFLIFGFSLIFLYLMSTLYHAVPEGRCKAILQQLDHAAIFVLIAGSYSAFCLSVLYSTVGVELFLTIWGLAALGISSQIFLSKRLAHRLSLVLYLLMGWLVIFLYPIVAKALPAPAFWLLLSGGISYTAGFVFYALQRIPWMHPIWHLFVLGGSVCHVLSVLWIF